MYDWPDIPLTSSDKNVQKADSFYLRALDVNPSPPSISSFNFTPSSHIPFRKFGAKLPLRSLSLALRPEGKIRRVRSDGMTSDIL